MAHTLNALACTRVSAQQPPPLTMAWPTGSGSISHGDFGELHLICIDLFRKIQVVSRNEPLGFAQKPRPKSRGVRNSEPAPPFQATLGWTPSRVCRTARPIFSIVYGFLIYRPAPMDWAVLTRSVSAKPLAMTTCCPGRNRRIS